MTKDEAEELAEQSALNEIWVSVYDEESETYTVYELDVWLLMYATIKKDWCIDFISFPRRK